MNATYTFSNTKKQIPYLESAFYVKPISKIVRHLLPFFIVENSYKFFKSIIPLNISPAHGAATTLP